MEIDPDNRKAESLNIKVQSYETNLYNDSVEAIYSVETFSEEVSLIVPPNQFTGFIFIVNDKGYIRNGEFIKGIRIEGIILKSLPVMISPHTKIFGVRMYGNGLYPFIPVMGKDIISQSKPVSFPEHEDLIQRIVQSKNDCNTISLISELLTSLYNPIRDKETQLVKEFYNYMKSCEKTLPNIKDFCEQTNTNYSTLNRAFQKILGLSTKKFERLIKFRRALQFLTASPERLTNIGIDAGYFDQSHFIREFKYFMNMPPTEYLNYLKTNHEHRNFNDIKLDVI